MQSRVPTQPCSLRIHIPTQRLDVVGANGSVLCSYSVSTSRFGIGSEPGSMMTPTGEFTIAEMIGGEDEGGMIFRSRVAVGRIGTEDEPDDFVQTRILWLSGTEPHNRNTKERYIYIHGTNQERQIGQPSSHGCVRMRNADVMELYTLVKTGFSVAILD